MSDDERDSDDDIRMATTVTKKKQVTLKTSSSSIAASKKRSNPDDAAAVVANTTGSGTAAAGSVATGNQETAVHSEKTDCHNTTGKHHHTSKKTGSVTVDLPGKNYISAAETTTILKELNERIKNVDYMLTAICMELSLIKKENETIEMSEELLQVRKKWADELLFKSAVALNPNYDQVTVVVPSGLDINIKYYQFSFLLFMLFSSFKKVTIKFEDHAYSNEDYYEFYNYIRLIGLIASEKLTVHIEGMREQFLLSPYFGEMQSYQASPLPYICYYLAQRPATATIIKNQGVIEIVYSRSP